MAEESHKSTHAMKHINRFIDQQVLWTLLVQTLVANLLLLTPTLYMLQVYDRILISKNELSLLMTSIGCLYLFLVLFLTELTRGRLLARLGNSIEARMGALAISHELLQKTSRNTASELKVVEALQEIKSFVSSVVATAILDIPFTPIYLIALYILHPVLLWGALFLVAIQSVFAWLSFKNSATLYQQAQTRHKHEAHIMRAYVRNFDASRAMGLVQKFELAWMRLRDIANHAATQSQSVAHAYASASKGLRYLQQAASLSLGAYLVVNDELSAGGMIAANVLTSRVLSPIDAVVTQWRSVRLAGEAMSRLNTLVELDKSSLRSNANEANSKVIEPIYQKMKQELVFPKGQVTLVIGESGAGKSTLVESMLGVSDHAGNIGTWQFRTDLGRVNLQSIDGKQIGFLCQRIELFDESVASNIARLEVPDSQEVVAVAKLLGLHHAILSLPKGYQTLVTPALPVGLRQRIALARAFYRLPPLLVLDEPNAGLDSAGEKALAAALQDAKEKGVTVVLAGHGALLMGLADHLVVMKDNEVIAFGPKAVVLASLATPMVE